MSSLIYFNESFWLRRETWVALQLFLIHLGAIWICLSWWCFLVTRHLLTKEWDLLGLLKTAPFAHSGNFIMWRPCDVGMFVDLQQTGTQSWVVLDKVWEQMSPRLVRRGLLRGSPDRGRCFRAGALCLSSGSLSRLGETQLGQCFLDLTFVWRVHSAGRFCRVSHWRLVAKLDKDVWKAFLGKLILHLLNSLSEHRMSILWLLFNFFSQQAFG